MILKWSIIDNLYSSIIGKCIFLLSSISIFSTIPLSIYVISTRSMAIALLGATILSITFVIYKINIPDIVANYSESEYYNFLSKLKKNDAFDIVHEFSVLESSRDVLSLPIFNNKYFKIYPFDNIENYKTIFGEDRALYYLSLIKYSLLDNSNIVARKFISSMFYIGCILLYFPTFYKISLVIIKGMC